jgi:hypothetical protein
MPEPLKPLDSEPVSVYRHLSPIPEGGTATSTLQSAARR